MTDETLHCCSWVVGRFGGGGQATVEPSFRRLNANDHPIVVWVRIPNFPLARYHPRILTELGNLVGTTVRIDDDTLHVNRGRYARIAVDIDLTRPLLPTVELDGKTLLLTYEGLPQVSDAGPGESELRHSVEATRGPQEPAPSNGYGPWTIVQWRRQRAAKGQDSAAGRASRTGQSRGGSRFAALVNQTMTEVETTSPVDMTPMEVPMG
ncbi:hypothetical protein K2173_023996 [Erythroxylum novogranatense]|uniref:DUF4283 domain-containing protein n=1 Tax=Erythroxylum novogranatense TaxID=1862640 RepID=A0AAV8TQ04_9ROSI|nr:hypothetical protein K2173_023996 [Erythroxylum novogranatense]